MNIPYPVFRAVSAAMSRDQCRFILNGIEVTPKKDGVVLAATDGRCLIASYVKGEHSFEKSFIIPRALVERVRYYKKAEFIKVAHNNARVSLTSLDGIEMTMPEVDGIYPPWRKTVSPKAVLERVPMIGFSENVVAPIFAAQKALDVTCAVADTYCEIGNEMGASFMALNKDTVAVLMPYRYSGMSFAWPKWATE